MKESQILRNQIVVEKSGNIFFDYLHTDIYSLVTFVFKGTTMTFIDKFMFVVAQRK